MPPLIRDAKQQRAAYNGYAEAQVVTACYINRQVGNWQKRPSRGCLEMA